MLSYLVGMGIISYLGDFGAGGIIGGVGIFKHVLDHGGNDTSEFSLYAWIVVTILFSVAIYYWAVASRLVARGSRPLRAGRVSAAGRRGIGLATDVFADARGARQAPRAFCGQWLSSVFSFCAIFRCISATGR